MTQPEWRDFEGVISTLSIVKHDDTIEFNASDAGNAASADIPIDDIWEIIDYLIEIAGPRCMA